ncbi:adhesion G protein-coupled receptor F5-like [Acanthaster planci]|uniref:Adhesion G protein-coupled receptor F5-like n=1 Tax=Acanthaster planci TaxID=133434 RepID=A0A8B7YAW8_ACAPL|nr:adhesion G protein-coupled receptor F5-like [Acanthaster planci]
MCNGKSPIAESSCNDQTCQDFCDPWPWGGCSSICGPIDKIFTIEVFFEFASSSSASGMSCSERQIYDPFLGRCRVLTCAAGFQIAGDECVIEDRVSDTPMSNTINCLSETLGIGTSSVFTSEHQHEAPDPNATAQSLYIVMLSATYISDFELAFDKAVEAIGFDPHESPLLCNISQVSLLLPFALNISNHCINSTVDGSKLIPVHNDTLMKVLEYNANPIDQKYSKLKASLICLKILDLNCSSLLFLDHLEYHIVSNSTIKIAASGSWLSDGEYVLFPDGIAVVCSFIGPTPEGLEPYIRRVISFVGSCLSLFALAATFVTYCVFSELRSLAGKLVMNLTVALFTAILMFLVPGYLAWNPTACVLGAVLAHFAWLAAFTFMTVIAVNVERSLTSLIQRKELSSGVNWTLVAYMTLAWGMPFAIVVICLVLQYCDCTSLPVIYSEGAVCWITDATVRLVVFVVPVGISLVSSTSLYVVTVVRLRQRRRATQIVRRQGRIEGATKEVAIYSKLCTLIGVTWLFGFVSQSVTGILAFSYIYIILNYLQGVFIFIAFCLNKRVRGLWKEKLEGPKEKPKKGAPSASKNNTHGSNTPATISSVSALNVPEDTKL